MASDPKSKGEHTAQALQHPLFSAPRARPQNAVPSITLDLQASLQASLQATASVNVKDIKLTIFLWTENFNRQTHRVTQSVSSPYFNLV